MFNKIVARRTVILGAVAAALYPEETYPMTRPRSCTNHLVVHGAFTPADLDIGAREIDRWHRQKRFLKIGYHCVIRRDGSIEEGRSEELIGAGVENHNEDSWHVCLVGGKDGDLNRWQANYTDAQYEALRSLLIAKAKEYPGAEVMGHNDFPGVSKGCPGFDVKAWFAAKS